jgi:hypothetical protein
VNRVIMQRLPDLHEAVYLNLISCRHCRVAAAITQFFVLSGPVVARSIGEPPGGWRVRMLDEVI